MKKKFFFFFIFSKTNYEIMNEEGLFLQARINKEKPAFSVFSSSHSRLSNPLLFLNMNVAPAADSGQNSQS